MLLLASIEVSRSQNGDGQCEFGNTFFDVAVPIVAETVTQLQFCVEL
jgi:hypothetical protein